MTLADITDDMLHPSFWKGASFLHGDTLERNLAVLFARKGGDSFAQIAKRFGLSRGHCAMIVNEMLEKGGSQMRFQRIVKELRPSAETLKRYCTA